MMIELAKSLITRKYAFEDDINIPSKLSVSEIKSLHLAKRESTDYINKMNKQIKKWRIFRYE